MRKCQCNCKKDYDLRNWFLYHKNCDYTCSSYLENSISEIYFRLDKNSFIEYLSLISGKNIAKYKFHNNDFDWANPEYIFEYNKILNESDDFNTIIKKFYKLKDNLIFI